MTREKAINYLKPIADSASLPRYAEALNMAISALRKQGDKDTNVPIKWIPVQEKLPERGQSVLILCKNKAMFTGYQLPDYSGEARWRIHTALNSARLLNRGRVTHWMPLPDVPEVEV